MDSTQIDHGDDSFGILLTNLRRLYREVSDGNHELQRRLDGEKEAKAYYEAETLNLRSQLGDARKNQQLTNEQLQAALKTAQQLTDKIDTLNMEIDRLKEQGGEDREREEKEDEALDAGTELTKAALKVAERWRKYRRWRDSEMNRLNAAAESCQAMLVALGVFEYRNNNGKS